MARKAKAKDGKSPKAKAPTKAAPVSGGGSPMLKILFSLVVLGGVAYGASVVKVGDRTVLQHGAELVHWDRVSEKGTQAARAATDAVREKLDEPPKPVAKKQVVARAQKPAEQLTKADREALERLLPE